MNIVNFEEERCVMCSAIIDEGRQCCPDCEQKILDAASASIDFKEPQQKILNCGRKRGIQFRRLIISKL